MTANRAKRRVLVFCRPYLIEDFRANVAPLSGSCDFRFLSDGHCPGVTDTRKRFYSRLGTVSPVRGLNAELELDVLSRCRYLRNLPQTQARNMIRAMASVLSEELDTFRPRAVLSHMVDDYTTQLLSELARLREITYVGYSYSYFPGKVQATRFGNGEPHDLREPGDEEVRATLERISQRTFRQNYLQKDTYTRARHLRAMLRYRMKQVAFAFKAWSERDPLHVHYGCLPYVVERRHWRDFPSPTDFHADWRERIRSASVAAAERPILYFPLGYFPEATINYWIEDRRFLEYERVVLAICAVLGSRFRVVVKEHLHMLGGRSPLFYRALRDIPGVISVPPLEFSNDVLGMCDIVLMGAGSIGVEAFIRGKPIASICDRSYWFSHARATFVDLSELETWPQILRDAIRAYVEPTEQERFEFVRQCLRSTMRMQRAGRRWPICEPGDLELALRAGLQRAPGTDAVADQAVHTGA
ncbi:MAG TPA: hypothetical protein VNZ53_25070 [Steroidobacteraceae bacterium]|nr:hypothetical protein [Steroidobacteraceae bacterium]